MMNRLWGTRCYLIGAMDRVKDNGETWRKWITPYLQNLGIIVLDPTNKPIDKGFENIESKQIINNMIKDGEYNESSKQMKLLRIIDLRMTDLADFLIFYLDPSIHLCGSYNEFFDSNKNKKPVLIVVKGGKNKVPNWVLGTIPHEMIFGNFDDLLEYINYVDSSEDSPPHYKRWTWFKYELMLPTRPLNSQNSGKNYKLKWEEIDE